MRRASIKAEILNSTNEEKANHIVRIKVYDDWYEALRAFYRENAAETRTWRVTFEPWAKVASESAVRLFHEIRDRICEAMGDSSKEHKDHIKATLKNTYGVVSSSGRPKSVTSYSVSELGQLIDGAFLMAYEAGADVRDLEPERREYR